MAVPAGVSLALTDGPLVDPPAWTRIDNQAGLNVTEIEIDRGRTDERSKTMPGTVTIKGFDSKGILDPTNATGPFYGNLDPVKQAAVSLYNPVDETWSYLFRGHVAELICDLDVSENFLQFELDLVDMLDILNDAEVIPDAAGNLAPQESVGDCFYTGQHCDDRLLAVLADTSTAFLGQVWPGSLLQIASGNVFVQGRAYSRNTSELQVIDEACDAEGPNATNRFITSNGAFAFRGRYYRYVPTAFIPPDGIRVEGTRMLHWRAGDLPSFATDNTLAVYTGLRFQRGKTNLINTALVTPAGIRTDQVGSQAVHDAASVAAYGVRTGGMSLENLTMSKGDDGNTAIQEAKSFGEAIVDNYKTPLTRVSQLVFRNPPAGASTARKTAIWKLLCGIELSDLITVWSQHPGGGGFVGVDHYVERINYRLTPLQGDEWNVTLTLDLSPRAYYATTPASWDPPPA